MNVLNDVLLFDGFFQFGCGAGTDETSLQVIVDAMVTSFDFPTFHAEWKSKFATTAGMARRDNTNRGVKEFCISPVPRKWKRLFPRVRRCQWDVERDI